MSLFSFRHSTKTFSKKVTRENRRAKLGQTAAHIRYITRKAAARTVISERLTSPNLMTAARQAEKEAERRRGRVCERFVVALPVECNNDQREALTRAYCQHMTKQRASFIAAIHDKNGNDKNNPHAHIVMFDAFIRTGGRGRPKSVLGMAKKNAIENAAHDWSRLHNQLMRNWGFSEASMIDHRSFAARGIDKIPTIHVGAGSSRAMKKNPPITLKPEWRLVDSGHTRAEANNIIHQINNTKGQIDAYERNDRLANRHGIDRISSQFSGPEHRTSGFRSSPGSREAKGPSKRDQSNKNGASTSGFSPQSSGELRQGEHSRGATPPFLRLANHRRSTRRWNSTRRIFRELIMLRDSLKLQLYRIQLNSRTQLERPEHSHQRNPVSRRSKVSEDPFR